mgnify:CR=1 FL=1
MIRIRSDKGFFHKEEMLGRKQKYFAEKKREKIRQENVQTHFLFVLLGRAAVQVGLCNRGRVVHPDSVGFGIRYGLDRVLKKL